MISQDTEAKLAGLFVQVSVSESDIEASRYSLCKCPEFDPYSVFQHLDKHALSSLSSTEIQLLLDKYHFYCTPDEAYQLIRQYDSNQNGRLTFNEFLQLVLPSTNPGFRELALARRGHYTSEVEYLLSKLIQQEILYHRSLENNRQDLVTRPDFNLLEAFRLIDMKNSSFITREALSSFISKYKILSDQDIDSIFRRIDNDGDQIISYLEFVDCVMPSKVKEKANLGRSVRSSSPLRMSSPIKDQYSSLHNTLNSEHQRNNSPLRNSPKRHSSPLRKSPTRQTDYAKTLHSSYNHSPPSREKVFSYSPSKSVTFSNPLNKFNLTENNFAYRRTSPLRNSPSKLNSSENVQSTPPPELREIVQMLQEDLKYSRELESAKNNLALKHDFNLIDCFRMLDYHDRGAFTQMDLEHSLERLGLRPSPDEMYLLIKHFSRLQDSRIRFSDFSEMLTPKQEEYSRIMRNKSALNIPGLDRFKVFARDTVAVLVNAFRILFEAEVSAELQRQRINRLPGFNSYQVFNYLDKDKNGFITITEFQQTLNAFRVPVNAKDLQVVMQKFDKNCDGRVSYSEFVEEITPKSAQLY